MNSTKVRLPEGKVRIYYVGGFPLPPGAKESEFQFLSFNQPFHVPPLGEFLEVDRWIAQDIIEKYGSEVFNLNGNLARDIKEGRASIHRNKFGQTEAVRELTEDEIIARYEQIQKAQAVLDKQKKPSKKQDDEIPVDEVSEEDLLGDIEDILEEAQAVESESTSKRAKKG